jgi:hypothetical protein
VKRTVRIITGAGVWAALAAALTIWAGSFSQRGLTPADKLAGELGEYFVGPQRRATIRFSEPVEVAVGDPVLQADGGRQIGWIQSIVAPETGRAVRQASVERVEVLLDGSGPPLPAGAQLQYRQAPHSLTEVLQVLVPESKRAELLGELQAVLAAHQAEMAAALTPIVEQSVGDVLIASEGKLSESVQKHQDDIRKLAVKYQHELAAPKIVPLVRTIVWPILQRRASPVAGQIGREVWQRASIWRFGWRYLYDSAPLPDMQLMDKEWQRFVSEDVAPVLEDHVDELVEVVQQVLGDSFRDPEVQAVLQSAARQILEDQELRSLAKTILQESLIDNPAVWEALRKRWTSPQAQDALRLCAAKLEPALRRVGDVVFGTPEGISPEFARVLRHQILGKDQHWLILESAAGPVPAGAVVGVVEVSHGDR